MSASFTTYMYTSRINTCVAYKIDRAHIIDDLLYAATR